ncbi:MAG: nucleotidyl transferase AbiEii/AbiGii toxin family protein [Chlamydiae bacterium]|nr:nucleotidyl transferase AbiEii/AbiGii toxin family protein [Chlamydiota bacterium]
MNLKKDIPAWEKLISAQEIFQSHFPECVLVGGTAASLHVGHRVSLDADYVLPDLKKRFGEILKKVEKEAGWHTKRIEPPVLILGHFQGVRTGIRQLIRSAPLKTTTIRGIRVPALEEMLRIKAYLIVRRNATRDFIDFVALFDHLGVKRATQALKTLDKLYPQEEGFSISQQLAIQLAEPRPWDLSQTDLSRYRALRAPYSEWRKVERLALLASQKIMTQKLE